MKKQSQCLSPWIRGTLVTGCCWVFASVFSMQASAYDPSSTSTNEVSVSSDRPDVPTGSEMMGMPSTNGDSGRPSRAPILIASLTVFVLAIFIGFEIINKIPPTLHTPLMSGSNAISGITIVGALVVAGVSGGVSRWLGWGAIILAMINVVGGFVVTHRMLAMFKRR